MRTTWLTRDIDAGCASARRCAACFRNRRSASFLDASKISSARRFKLVERGLGSF